MTLAEAMPASAHCCHGAVGIQHMPDKVSSQTLVQGQSQGMSLQGKVQEEAFQTSLVDMGVDADSGSSGSLAPGYGHGRSHPINIVHSVNCGASSRQRRMESAEKWYAWSDGRAQGASATRRWRTCVLWTHP